MPELLGVSQPTYWVIGENVVRLIVHHVPRGDVVEGSEAEQVQGLSIRRVLHLLLVVRSERDNVLAIPVTCEYEKVRRELP